MSQEPWPQDRQLGPAAIHLWLVELDGAAEHDWTSVLNTEERSRQQRLVFAADRNQFVAAHALQREALALYCKGATAASLEFTRLEHGKPKLLHAGPAFSLSHSGRYAVLAVYDGRELGVDIEVHRPNRRFDELAARCFDSGELAAYRALAPDAQLQRFYELWTLKEAVIKAGGRGLAMPLQDFGFRVDDRSGRLVLRMAATLPEASLGWWCQLLRVIDRCSLAICWEQAAQVPVPSLRAWRCWPGSWVESVDWSATMGGHRPGDI